MIALPTEIWGIIFLHLNFSDIVSVMTTCSDMWLRLRYNSSLWKHYHSVKYGDDIPLKKLGDPFLSVRRRSYGRWMLAKKVIDFINTPGVHCHVYGGYLRDRLAKRMDFNDINVFVYYTDWLMLFGHIENEIRRLGFSCSRHNLYSHGGVHFVISNGCDEVVLNMVIGDNTCIAVDFDINGLYLIEPHKYKLAYSDDPKELEKVINKCKKRQFSLHPIRINTMSDLTERYNHMCALGFSPIETKYRVPPKRLE